MAGGSNKRRPSRSPSRLLSTTKKARQGSNTASLRSQRDPSAPQLSRAKSVFRGQRDPYFPLSKKGDSSLPSSDDYVFRIQVISTSTDVSSNVFKKAVQGLVKICFPQDVLDELGVDVVMHHMRSEDAPEENIAKMISIFRSEMIHRVTWMLAEYLDSSAKVEASVKAIIAASASIHGAKVGEDILGDVVESLDDLRKKIPGDSTELLSNTTDMESWSLRVAESEISNNDGEDTRDVEHASPTFSFPGEPPEAEHQPALSARRKKTKEKTKTSVALEPEEAAQSTREGKEGKISTSWRWDVQGVTSIADVSAHFQRTSDLFAYHALPIVKQRLGSEAKRKELRQEIQMMLNTMPDEEFHNWTDSFRKLQSGDTVVLKRFSPAPSISNNHIVSATPAAVVRQPSMQIRERDIYQDPEENRDAELANSQTSEQISIKRECVMDGEFATAAGNSSVTPNIQGPVQNGSVSRESLTPIVDLLWKPSPLEPKARETAVRHIMDTLNRRVIYESIRIQLISSKTQLISKEALKVQLMNIVAFSVSQYDHISRKRMEIKLLPWVVANPTHFPELLTEPLFFVNMMPCFHAVLDTLCDPDLSMSKSNSLVAKRQLFAALESRKISRFTIVGSKGVSLAAQISSVLGKSEKIHSDALKRGWLERILRYLALDYRGTFAELKSTALVEAWERETGQLW